MPKFMCMQRSIPSDSANSGGGEPPSPEQMQAMYARFDEWKTRYADSLVDLGGRLRSGKVATAQGVVDGPFMETKELIGGYMIVEAESLDAAIEIARACPGVVRPGSGVEVREIMTG